MVARYLVTTAIESTWPQEKPILFLGEWCRTYNRKSLWSRLDYEVAPYHWDDRKKLLRDQSYLQDLFENQLEQLSEQLNVLHGVKFSSRYWRILVGPWLGYFLQIVFDRWAMLESAYNQYEIEEVLVQGCREEYLIPNDMTGFINCFLSDEWNEAIFAELLEYMGRPISVVSLKADSHALPRKSSGKLKERAKVSLTQVATKVSGWLSRCNEYVLISSYLPLKLDLLLQVKLGQLPKIWRQMPVPRFRLGREMHEVHRQTQLNLPSILPELIMTHIPLAYREGYKELADAAEKLPWPSKPKAIFTSNAYVSDELFKVWAAKRVEEGVPLVIGQHGGNDGMASWSFVESHQIRIADRYLTWGWSRSEHPKVVPVGNFKNANNVCKPDLTGKALLVQMSLPRMSYFLYSVPIASQWLSYLDDQFRFVKSLPRHIQDQLLVRLFPEDYGWCQKQRWKDAFPFVQLDEARRPMASSMRSSRISISTYNATTYLESMSLDFPTLMFWNPNHWEVRESVQHDFDALRSVGIFHDSPESAAKRLTAIWDDVSGWWNHSATKDVRRKFCDKYSKKIDRPIAELAEQLQEIVRPDV